MTPQMERRQELILDLESRDRRRMLTRRNWTHLKRKNVHMLSAVLWLCWRSIILLIAYRLFSSLSCSSCFLLYSSHSTNYIQVQSYDFLQVYALRVTLNKPLLFKVFLMFCKNRSRIKYRWTLSNEIISFVYKL